MDTEDTPDELDGGSWNRSLKVQPCGIRFYCIQSGHLSIVLPHGQICLGRHFGFTRS